MRLLCASKSNFQQYQGSLVYKDKAQRHHYWMFEVGRSMFDVHLLYAFKVWILH